MCNVMSQVDYDLCSVSPVPTTGYMPRDPLPYPLIMIPSKQGAGSG